MGNAHFSNVKPVPERSTEIYSLSSERKTHTNPVQFKSFWGCGDLFSKRSRIVPRKHGVRGKPLFLKRGFPGYFPSSSFEVVKMSKGKWTRHTHLFEKDEYECSVCHETFDKPSAVCPKCGTKMKSSVKYDASWVDEMADYDSMFGDDD